VPRVLDMPDASSVVGLSADFDRYQ